MLIHLPDKTFAQMPKFRYTDKTMSKQLGIVFTGGEAPDSKTVRGVIDSLEENALTVAADSGLLIAEAAGLVPDWIIGDMDSIGSATDAEDHLRLYPVDRILRYPAEKDFTDTELALALLREKGCDEAWIIGGGGGRLDHLLGIRDLFEREYFPRRWITAAEDVHCIDAAVPGNKRLTASLKPGSIVSVLLLGNAPWKAVSMGLKWQLDNVRWERGLYGLSNVALEDEISIDSQQGRFLIIL